MKKTSQNPAPGDPPRPTTKTDKACWFKDEVHVHDAKLKSYLRKSFPTIDVEAVVQESYVRTWLAHAASPVTSAKAYLFTVARRLALNTARHQKKSPITTVSDLSTLDVIDESTDTVETVAAAEEIALLAKALASLPPRCREIIVLRAYQDIPQREVAALLSISETTVATQVYLGMRRLEAFFTNHGVTRPRAKRK